MQKSILNYQQAYPQTVVSTDNNHVTLKNGDKIIYDDNTEKSFAQRLINPSLKDQLHDAYVKGKKFPCPPPENFDPGRYRNMDFFTGMYGKTEQEVADNLVEIAWLPKHEGSKIKVTKINDVDKKLSNISQHLDQLSEEYTKYVTNIGGTFKWREIAGTKRLSPHSFGIAIDINVKLSNYWRWASQPYTYHNQIPLDIVEIFEQNGFIWGGKWHEYDTMHFEYRPELLIP